MMIPHVLDNLRLKARGIVHAGAHYAEEMKDYLRFDPSLIVWIEGDPAHVEVIEREIAAHAGHRARQIAIQALITDQDNVPTEFYRFSNEGQSSSVYRETDFLKSTWQGVHETGDVVMLPSRRLDTALLSRGVLPSQIDILVIDLQGAELLALAGAGDFLPAAEFVELELSSAEFYAGGAQSDDVIALMTGHGFERITPLQHHGDVVFRNTRRRGL